ncbi:MAG TPA: phosphatase PAP2 family protein [Sunxiuqinia sp.]|nr:phosphatase PAP2 family protein [Sunxiuqinia sp.]
MKTKHFFVLLLLLPIWASAQIDSLKINHDYAAKCWQDTKTVFTAPAHWDGRDWTTFGAVTASTAALFLVDDPIETGFQNMHEWGGQTGRNISANFLEPWGGYYSMAVIGGFVGYGLLAKNLKSQSTGLLALESFALASAVVQIPKRLIGRHRPDSSPNATPYDIGGPLQGKSMPSGHTTAVFAVASVIANQFADTHWVPVLSYTVATAVGLSRLYDHRHWLSDTVAGAAIGIAVGNLVCHKKNKPGKLAIIPFSSKDFRGVKLALSL